MGKVVKKATFKNHNDEGLIRAHSPVVEYLVCTEETRVQFAVGPLFLVGGLQIIFTYVKVSDGLIIVQRRVMRVTCQAMRIETFGFFIFNDASRQTT